MSLPFVDDETGAIDRGRVLTEAVPLAKLVGLVALVALVPFVLSEFFGSYPVIGALLPILTQFVLAVGAGIVLLYVVARGTQIAEE